MEEKVDKPEDEQKEAVEKLYAFIIEQMKAGADKSVISQKLMEMGVDMTEAYQLVETVYSEIEKAAEEEQVTAGSIMPALVGGGLAAVVGGVIWGLIIIATGYEIGFVAWAMGWLTGFAVVLFSKGRRGVPLQAIAVLASVLGILIGKYFTFYHYFHAALAKNYGEEAASNISILSGSVMQFFIENIGSMVGGFDILWVILAVITAWRIPKGMGIKVPR